MICPCGGPIKYSESVNKKLGIVVYSRRCPACHREEKSVDEVQWLAPAAFWAKHKQEHTGAPKT
jgi:hypothetical protein